MESFQQFLETASISGLNHISSTRRWARLFWITLVIVSFVMSSLLIWESFQSWADNPVRTTTRTVPMKEMKFPKLTVCPPKNTFTDLNYDLILAENVTLTDKKKNQLYEYIVAMIDEHVYMDPWDKLHEENRFYNWYNGFTSMYKEPHYRSSHLFEFEIFTTAASGVITTQYFEERFNPSLVENKQTYSIKLFPARSIRYNENVTLFFKIEQLSLLGGFDKIMVFKNGVDLQMFDANLLDISFNPPISNTSNGQYQNFQYLYQLRDVSDREIAEANLRLMPGFRLTWYYTGIDFKPKPFKDNLKYDKINKDFIREVFFSKMISSGLNTSTNPPVTTSYPLVPTNYYLSQKRVLDRG